MHIRRTYVAERKKVKINAIRYEIIGLWKYLFILVIGEYYNQKI